MIKIHKFLFNINIRHYKYTIPFIYSLFVAMALSFCEFIFSICSLLYICFCWLRFLIAFYLIFTQPGNPIVIFLAIHFFFISSSSSLLTSSFPFILTVCVFHFILLLLLLSTISHGWFLLSRSFQNPIFMTIFFISSSAL